MQTVLTCAREPERVLPATCAVVEHACIKLLCAMVAQVVSTPAPETAAPLVRQPSGAALSGDVFRMLYEELLRRLDKYLQWKATAIAEVCGAPCSAWRDVSWVV